MLVNSYVISDVDIVMDNSATAGVDIAAGVLLHFFSFLCRGRKIGAMGAGIRSRDPNVLNNQRR